MTKKPKNHQIVIRLSEKLYKQIDKASEKKGLTMASWGRQVFIEVLEKGNG